METSRPIQPTD
jgi:hypothetical protein